MSVDVNTCTTLFDRTSASYLLICIYLWKKKSLLSEMSVVLNLFFLNIILVLGEIPLSSVICRAVPFSWVEFTTPPRLND